MIINMNFGVEKDKEEIVVKYDHVLLKIRFKVFLDENPFYMDTKMFKILINDTLFKKALKMLFEKEYKSKRVEIEEALTKTTELFESVENRIEYQFVGHGFNANLVFNNSKIDSIQQFIDKI